MIAIIFILSVVIIGYLVYTAPYGWEDENGFHYGRPESYKKLPTHRK